MNTDIWETILSSWIWRDFCEIICFNKNNLWWNTNAVIALHSSLLTIPSSLECRWALKWFVSGSNPAHVQPCWVQQSFIKYRDFSDCLPFRTGSTWGKITQLSVPRFPLGFRPPLCSGAAGLCDCFLHPCWSAQRVYQIKCSACLTCSFKSTTKLIRGHGARFIRVKLKKDTLLWKEHTESSALAYEREHRYGMERQGVYL